MTTFEKIAAASARVQVGSRWLDGCIFNWREELRGVASFRITHGESCVLGSLEHRVWQHERSPLVGAMVDSRNSYEIALEVFGFNLEAAADRGFLFHTDYSEFSWLQWLWEAEFSEIPGIGFAAFRRAALT